MTPQKCEGPGGHPIEVLYGDHNPSGTGNAGQENAELEWARRHVRDEPEPEAGSEPEGRPEPALDVFRKTELHNTPPDPGEAEIRELRSRMMPRLKCRDPKIPYREFETSFREFLCPLLVRQYREENELRAQLAALWDEIGRLDERLERNLARLDRRLDAIEERGRE